MLPWILPSYYQIFIAQNFTHGRYHALVNAVYYIYIILTTEQSSSTKCTGILLMPYKTQADMGIIKENLLNILFFFVFIFKSLHVSSSLILPGHKIMTG